MKLALAAMLLAGAGAAALFANTLRLQKDIEARNPPRGAFVEVDGVRLHVERRDPPGAPRANLLLIHGASGNLADMMLPLADELVARGFRVFAIDRPGHGYSDRLRENPSSPAAQAAAFRAALEQLGVGEAIVVAHSLAGSLAASFLLDQPDFAQGAVLIAPVTHPWPRGVRWYYRLAATPVLGWLFVNLLATPAGLAAMDGAVAGVFAPNAPPEDYAHRSGATLVLRPNSFRANAEDVAGLNAFLEQQAPRMPAIRRPVAIVSGDHDAVVLTELHSFGSAREIPGATLKMLPGVGHSPHWIRPDAVLAAIEQVADRVQSARAMRPEIVPSAPSASSQ